MSRSSDQPISAVRFARFRTLVDAEFRTTGQVTVVCGPNNSGKSSLLDAAAAWVALRSAGSLSQVAEEVRGDARALVEGGIEVGVDLSRPEFAAMLRSAGAREGLIEPAVRWFVDQLGLAGDSHWWIPVTLAKANLEPLPAFLQEHQRTGPLSATSVANQASRAHTRTILQSQNSPNQAVTKAWFSALFDCLIPRGVDVRRIRDVRRVSDHALTDADLEALAIAAAPTTHDPPQKREQWARDIEIVLQEVFGPGTRYQAISVGAAQYRLILSLDGQDDVPVEHVGAGVREVIAIAFTALSRGGADVLCIEEPENCLHPTAARRLIRSLAQLTETQLIVTTHSAAVVNSEPHSIIELERSGAESTTRVVSHAAERFRAVRSLGHSPADLVLAHCAVWVEGPSDRAYLSAWLRTRHGLEEGDDYSIMFYGGSIGATIGIEQDPAQTLFAQVRPLCRRCVMVADSDVASKSARRKPHVLRWIREARNDNDVLVLTTPFREVENCAPLAAINSVRVRYKLKPLREIDLQYERVIPANSGITKSLFAESILEQSQSVCGPQAHAFVDAIAQFIVASRTE